MDSDWLAAELGAGRSIESLARELGSSASTVARRARRYDLASPYAGRHASRGGLRRDELERLVAAGLSTRAIALEVDRSQGTVRHWLREYGLVTAPAARRSSPRAASPAREVERECRRHGLTRHSLRSDGGGLRCLRCRSEAVAKRRRRVKALLVAEAGGACAACGYSRSLAALQFHHLDPAGKRFSLAVRGVTRSLERAREEVRKCVLLCANCHAEVESGLRAPPLDSRSRRSPAQLDPG